MIKVSIRRINPGKKARLQEWLHELNARADEVRETFVDEAVWSEQAFIVEGADGPLLVFAAEGDNFEHARRAYQASSHPIDQEHRAVVAECVGESLGLMPIYDVTRRALSKPPAKVE